jgi:hypothetical protein
MDTGPVRYRRTRCVTTAGVRDSKGVLIAALSLAALTVAGRGAGVPAAGNNSGQHLVLLGHSTGGTGLPAESAFVTIFVAGAITAGLATILIALSGTRVERFKSSAATVDSRAMNHEWG